MSLMTPIFSYVLGPTTQKNQDWFDENDEEIKEMLAEKNRLHRIYQLEQSSAAKKTAFTNIRRTVQTRLRNMQDSWLAAKADEIQKYADTHDSKRFYDALNAVYGPQSSLLNADGTTLITDKPAILNRWAEHFSAVLNRPADINAEAIARLPQVETNTDLDRPPSEEEVKKAIKQLFTGKAPGGRSILVLSSTDQQISTPKLLPACHKLRQTPISTDHPARKKSRKQSSNSLLEKPQVQMPSLPKYTSMAVTRCY